MRSIASTNSSGRPLGVPSSSRTCRWATVAPAPAAPIVESAISSVVYGMFGLFSRKTSAPVIAHVTTTGLAVPGAGRAHVASCPERASKARSSSVIGRDARPIRVPQHDPELGLDDRLPAAVDDPLAGGHALVPQLANGALDGDRLEGRIDLAVELDRAAPHHVLVAGDSARLEERVAALLQVRQDDRVVDVAEPVEVAPAHLHRVTRVHAGSPTTRPRARRSGSEPRTSSSA